MRLSVPRKSGPPNSVSKKTSILFVSAIALVLTGCSMMTTPAYSALANPGSALQYQINDASLVIEVRRGGGGRHMGGGGRRPGGGGHFAGGRRPGGGGHFAGGRRPGGGRHFAGGGRPGGGRPGIGRPGVGRPGVVRPGVVAGGRGRWVRPYRWAPGGAIAAGAAIGFVTAATAAAWAGAPPVAGYCWYYTDLTQTQGFWDVCP